MTYQTSVLILHTLLIHLFAEQKQRFLHAVTSYFYWNMSHKWPHLKL